MADRTKLLDYIMDTATDLARENGYSGSPAHFFVIAMFKVARLAHTGSLWEKVRAMGAGHEMATAFDSFGVKKEDTEKVIEGLLAYVKSDDYNSTVDEALWGKLQVSAEFQASADSRSQIEATDFAKAIISEASGELYAHITAAVSGEVIDSEEAPEEGELPPTGSRPTPHRKKGPFTCGKGKRNAEEIGREVGGRFGIGSRRVK